MTQEKPSIRLKPRLKIIDGQITTTSLDVAEKFGKPHKHVLRDIRNLLESMPEGSEKFASSNFGPVKQTMTYIDSSGHQVTKETSRVGHPRRFPPTEHGFHGQGSRQVKSRLHLLLCVFLATSPAHADDGFDFIGNDAQSQVPSSVNPSKVASTAIPDCGMIATDANNYRQENLAQGSDTQNTSLLVMGLGAGVLDASIGMSFAGPGLVGLVVLAPLMVSRDFQKRSAFFAGTVLRGSVLSVAEGSQDFIGRTGWATLHRLNEATLPGDKLLDETVVQVKLDTGDAGIRWVFAPISAQLRQGDVVDIKQVSGRSARFKPVWETNDQSGDFNKHMPRVISIVCPHGDKSCQAQAKPGLLCRHTDTEFPPSQYLIDPAIIAADQARMRREEADKKAARNSGGFNFM